MSDAQDAALSLVHTRLHRLDGAVRQTTTPTDGGPTAVDFDLEFPAGPLVRDAYRRRVGLSKSCIRVNTDGRIGSFRIRLPPIPADDEPYSSLYAVTLDMALECSQDFYVTAKLSTGGNKEEAVSWWPHVYLQTDRFGRDVTPEAVTRFVRRLFHQYCERYEGGV